MMSSSAVRVAELLLEPRNARFDVFDISLAVLKRAPIVRASWETRTIPLLVRFDLRAITQVNCDVAEGPTGRPGHHAPDPVPWGCRKGGLRA